MARVLPAELRIWFQIHRIRLKVDINCGFWLRLLMNRKIVDESCVACRAADPRSEIHRLRLKIGINCGSWLRLLMNR